MQLKDIKPYSVFLGICALSLVVAMFCGFVYLQYMKELDQKEVSEQDIAIEIKLPIIEWGTYESLSKHYLNGNIPSGK